MPPRFVQRTTLAGGTAFEKKKTERKKESKIQSRASHVN